VDGRARVSKQTTSCIRIHTDTPNALIAAQHERYACTRYHAEIARNPVICAIFAVHAERGAHHRRYMLHVA
jgi:hypothetical protein